ncbi:MAG: fused MFS/spermidine synthase, partial [Myxococcota bacterium]
PSIFPHYYELPLGVIACGALTYGLHWTERGRDDSSTYNNILWNGATLLAVVIFGAYVVNVQKHDPALRSSHRNFFGVLRVLEQATEAGTRYTLVNGRTRHGSQLMNAPETAISYFGPITGLGLIFGQRPDAPPRRIGVVGLGIGTIAAYGRPWDQITFYEIDPDVAHIAKDGRYFRYLRDSAADTRIVLGDARLSLETELRKDGGNDYDILVVDAFNSDAIPMHLLTQEAFRLYLAHLAKDGVLAVHITSLHLELAPSIHRVGNLLGINTFEVRNSMFPLSDFSRWVILSQDLSLKRSIRFAAKKLGATKYVQIVVPSPVRTRRAPLLTDDYSNVFELLLLPDSLRQLPRRLRAWWSSAGP